MPPNTEPTAKNGESRTRKRKKCNDDSTAAKPRRKRPKKKAKKKSTRRIMDSMYIESHKNLERPTASDFNCGFSSLHRAHYFRLPDTPTSPPVQNSLYEETNLAPSPHIPSPDDDNKMTVTVHYPSSSSDDEQDNEAASSDANKSKSARKKQKQPRIIYSAHSQTAQLRNKINHLSFRNAEPEPEPETEPFKKPHSCFMAMPREIRDHIYRELLVAEKPILVHGGWKFVYKRNRLSLFPKILVTCKQIYHEARQILYGKNTFHYRLRDPSSSTRRLAHLATDDAVRLFTDEEDDDDGSEYEGETAASSRRRPRPTKKSDWDIKIERYLPLFRRIIVEAEKNRYSEETQESMAKALQAFSKINHAGKPSKFNIHTLTIRVTPLWESNGREDGQGFFTFLNFFQPGASVLDAIRSINCQFLQIDILTRYVAVALPQQHHYHHPLQDEQGAYRLKIDRRHQQIAEIFDAEDAPSSATTGTGCRGRLCPIDWWAKDLVMQIRRKGLARQSAQAVNAIGAHIEKQCWARKFDVHSNSMGGIYSNVFQGGWSPWSYVDEVELMNDEELYGGLFI